MRSPLDRALSENPIPGSRYRASAVRGEAEVSTALFRKLVGEENWKGGSVTLDRSVQSASLSREQRRALDTARIIAGVTGVNIRFFRSETDDAGRFIRENGSYSRSERTISIDINAGRNRVTDSMERLAIVGTISHELTHSFQQNAPEEYEKLKSAVLDVLSRSGASLSAMIAEAMDRDRSIRDISSALDEIVAKACEDMLTDSDALNRLKSLHPMEARSFLDHVREIVGRIRDALGRALGETRSRSIEAQIVRSSGNDLIRQLFTEAAVKGAEVAGQMNRNTAEVMENVSEAVDAVDEAGNTQNDPVPEADETTQMQRNKAANGDSVKYMPRMGLLHSSKRETEH